jgi:hypothetical protein
MQSRVRSLSGDSMLMTLKLYESILADYIDFCAASTYGLWVKILCRSKEILIDKQDYKLYRSYYEEE